MIVRDAELWDVPALFELAERFHSEAAPGFPLPEPLAIYQTIIETKAIPDLCCFVAEETVVTGFLTGAAARPPHSFKRVAGMTMFYVDPKHRGGKTYSMLFRRFMEWCHASGARVVSCGSISGIKEERFGKFLERAGFRKAGDTYMKAL